MANQTDLRVRISADLADIKQGLGLLRGELAKVKSQASTSLGGGANAFTSGIKTAHRELRAFAATYLSLQGGRLLAGVADEATQIRGRIREAKGDYQAILSLANETRTGLLATTELYTRMERSTRNQGVSQERLLKITKAVNQAVKLSYADTNTANAAITQFAQGLAAGVLRGQDLNSVIAGTPILAEAIARGLGKQVGEIKKLGEQGKLTSKEVLGAIESQAKRLEEEYARVPVTIGDAFTQIRNSFVDFIGDADQASGASQKFAATLQQIAKDLPQYLNPLLDTIRLLLENLDVLAVFIGTRLALSAVPALIKAFAALRAMIVSVRAATLSLEVVMAAFGGPIGIALAALAAGLYLLWKRTNDAKVAAEQHAQALSENADMAKVDAAAALKDAQAKRVLAAETLKAARAALEERRIRFAAANTSATARGGDRGDAAALASTNALNRQRDAVAAASKEYKEWGDRLAELSVQLQLPIDIPDIASGGSPGLSTDPAAKKVAASNALMRDSVDRAIAELERLYKAGEIGIQHYFATRTQLQQQSIDLEIEQARNELAVTKDKGQRIKIEEQIIILQRDRAEVAKAAAQEEQRASDDMIDKLGEVQAKLAELDGNTAKAARIRIYAEFHELFKQLEVNSDETGKKMVQNLVERLITKAQADAIASRVSAITGNLSAQEGSISAQMEAGTLGMAEGERRLQDIRQKTLEQLREQRELQAAVLRGMSVGSPDFAAAEAGLAAIDTDIANVTASMNKFEQGIEDVAVSSLTGFFDDLIDGAKSFKDAFIDMVRSFAAGVAKMIAQELALRAVRSLLAGFGGGGAAVANAKGNVFGNGGMQAFAKGAAFALPGLMAFANGGAFTNGIFSNPTLFKFGAGGQFGVMGEAGPEAVMPLTRGPGGRLGVDANGSGGGKRTRVIVVDDRRQAQDYMTPGFEEAQLVFLGRNAGKVKEILGG